MRDVEASQRPSAHGPQLSKGRVWIGRILSTLSILFLLFDAAGKFAKPQQVTDAFARLGLATGLTTTIGILLLVCTALYAVPRTSVLGAVLLTGYLGGAVAIQMRAASPTFETIFPVLFGILAWLGVWLRDGPLRRILPVRR